MNSRRRIGPPVVAEWLVARSLPRADREPVLADLAELFAYRSVESSVFAARLWYWSMVLSFPARLLLDRVSLRPHRPSYSTIPSNSTSRSLGAVMSSFLQDVRYALRGYRRTPGFIVVATVTLALGIGFTTAMFSVVNGILLRPLPGVDPGRLVKLVTVGTEGENHNHSGANFIDIQNLAESFEDVAAYVGAIFTVAGPDSPSLVRGASVTANFFSLIGADASLGRTLMPDADLPGGERAVVLSHGMWLSHLGGDVAAIGQQLQMNGELFTVVGVMPPAFSFPEETAFWAASKFEVPEPYESIGEDPASVRNIAWFDVFGRLRADVTLGQAQAELGVVTRQLQQLSEEAASREELRVVPLRETIVGGIRPSLYVLFGAVGFLLLIACANVANLTLVRASGRYGELVVRAALGAGRMRLMRQLVTESLVLALVGGALGIPIAMWGTHLLLAMAPDGIPRVDQVAVDWHVLSFAFGASLGTGVLFGLAPAVQTLGSRLGASTVVGLSRQTFGRTQSRLGSALIIGEVGVSLLLLVGAGLLLRTFVTLNSVDPGFETENTLSGRVWIPQTRYGEDEEVSAFYRETLERVRAIPGVSSAGAVLSLPIGAGITGRFGFAIEGYTPDGERGPVAGYQVATPDYFESLGIRLVRGRTFSEGDDAEAPFVAVINEALAELYWRDDDPIGRRITWDDPTGDDVAWSTIVGIVGNTRDAGLDTPPRPEVYRSYQQSPIPYMTLVVRSDRDAAVLTSALRAAVAEVDPQQPLSAVRTMDRVLFDSLGSERFNMYLLCVFAFAALSLAAVGLYGVLSFSVAQRSNEIGIRMALGARTGGIVGQIAREGLWLTGAGLAIGTCAAFALTRLMASMIHGVSATDPLAFVGGIVLLTAIASVASWIPARRAARLSPMEVLRVE